MILISKIKNNNLIQKYDTENGNINFEIGSKHTNGIFFLNLLFHLLRYIYLN